MTRPIRTGAGSRAVRPGSASGEDADRTRRRPHAGRRLRGLRENVPPAGPVSSSSERVDVASRPVGDGVGDEASVVLRRQHQAPRPIARQMSMRCIQGSRVMDEVEEVAEGADPLSGSCGSYGAARCSGSCSARLPRDPAGPASCNAARQLGAWRGGRARGPAGAVSSVSRSSPERRARSAERPICRCRSAGSACSSTIPSEVAERRPAPSIRVQSVGRLPVAGSEARRPARADPLYSASGQRHGLLVPSERRDVLDGGADHGGHLTRPRPWRPG